MREVQALDKTMEAQHTTLRQPSYLTLWGLWFLATAGYGVVWAAVIYIWGPGDPVSWCFPFFGGLWLGISQALVVQRYLAISGWWTWVTSTSIGWFCAMFILFLGTFVIGGGSMLNDVNS